MTICFKKMDEKAIIPTFGHGDDTNFGVDLYACLDKILIVHAKECVVVPTQIAWMPIDIPYNSKVGMLIKSRSGLAFKDGIEASNAGVIDETYRGVISVKLYNNGTRDFVVEHGMRVAQGIIQTVPKYAVVEVEELDVTERGDRGFGSSGR
jgi:dUTP pyrophosphatase